MLLEIPGNASGHHKRRRAKLGCGMHGAGRFRQAVEEKRSESAGKATFHFRMGRIRLCCERRDRKYDKGRPGGKVTGAGDLTRRDGEVIVETIFDAVIGALKSGDKIEIRGFGSFRIRQRNPRIGRNPKSGERVEVPAKKVPYFKPSKELRDLVNPKEAKSAA